MKPIISGQPEVCWCGTCCHKSSVFVFHISHFYVYRAWHLHKSLVMPINRELEKTLLFPWLKTCPMLSWSKLTMKNADLMTKTKVKIQIIPVTTDGKVLLFNCSRAPSLLAESNNLQSHWRCNSSPNDWNMQVPDFGSTWFQGLICAVCPGRIYYAFSCAMCVCMRERGWSLLKKVGNIV